MGGMKLRFQSYQTCFQATLFRVEAALVYFDETNYRRFEHAVVLESIIGRVGGSMAMLIMGGGVRGPVRSLWLMFPLFDLAQPSFFCHPTKCIYTYGIGAHKYYKLALPGVPGLDLCQNP